MKVAIISSVVGNFPISKECIDTWLPLPENWELFLYKSKYTYFDGTAEYLDEKKKEYNINIIEDGEHRTHTDALSILLNEVKPKQFDWLIHLDSDAKLLNRDFYTWAKKTFSEQKYKVWGKNHIRSTSKIQPYEKMLYLGRAHPWLIMVDMNFLEKHDLSFDDMRVEGRLTKPTSLNKKNGLSRGDRITIFGDTGWQIYTEASRFGLYQNLPDEVYDMWHHINNQSVLWMRKNKFNKNLQKKEDNPNVES